MDFSTVVKSLRSIDIEQVRLDNPQSELWSVQYATDADVVALPDILYLGRLSQVRKPLQSDGPISLLLLKDAPLTDILLAHTDLNLALLPETTDLNQVFPRLQTVFQDGSRIISGMSILLDALLEDKGLQQLAETASMVFGMPVLITDNSYKHLALAGIDRSSAGLAELDSKSGYIADSLVQEIQERRIDEMIRKAGRPILLRSNRGDEFLVAAVVIHGVDVAHISLPTGGRPTGAVEREMLRRFSQVVATELQKNNFFKVNRGSPHASFLADLFESKINTLIDVRKRLSILGFSLKKTHQIICISIRDHIASESRLQMITSHLSKLLINSVQMIYLGDIVFLVSRTAPTGLGQDELTDIRSFLADNKLTGGVSNRFGDILDARRHYTQARKAASLGTRAMSESSLYRFEDLLIEMLAEACQDRVSLQDLCHPAALQLLQADKQQLSQLFETLRIYLDCARNPTRAAARLDIHRNTLFYRVAKISELTGVSFEDGDQLMRLSLSIRLIDYITASGGGRNIRQTDVQPGNQPTEDARTIKL